MSWKIWKNPIRRRSQTQPIYPGSVLKVVFRQCEDGYVVAECLQLPGCMSQGKTKEEANQNIVDAIKSVLAVRMNQILSEAVAEERFPDDLLEEESFRVEGPELVSC